MIKLYIGCYKISIPPISPINVHMPSVWGIGIQLYYRQPMMHTHVSPRKINNTPVKIVNQLIHHHDRIPLTTGLGLNDDNYRHLHLKCLIHRCETNN